jgi:hypothetical protein
LYGATVGVAGVVTASYTTIGVERAVLSVAFTTDAALATPAVRAVTAAAAIRIFFIDICMIPLEVL